MNFWQKLLNFFRAIFNQNSSRGDVSNKKFGMTQVEFEQHVARILANPTLLCQTHYTDFCGFYAFLYCWVPKEPTTFKQFIFSLYHYKEARFNGKDFIVRKEIESALEKGLKADSSQDWGILNNQLPHKAEMLIALTLADTFSFLPFYYEPYCNERHFENKAIWAGMSMASQERLFRSFGFDVMSIGNDFVETELFPFDEEERGIVTTSLQQQKKLILLVNSWQMISGCIDPYPPNYTARNNPGFPTNGLIGTHWIILLNYNNTEAQFWDYGAEIPRKYKGDILDCTAGFLVAH